MRLLTEYVIEYTEESEYRIGPPTGEILVFLMINIFYNFSAVKQQSLWH